MGDMPWSPRSRSQQGMKSEKQIIQKRGGVVHPRSGAGQIKDDGHSSTEQYEVKDAAKTYQLKGSELEVLRKRAVRQGREPVFIVYFADADVTATITITKGKG